MIENTSSGIFCEKSAVCILLIFNLLNMLRMSSEKHLSVFKITLKYFESFT